MRRKDEMDNLVTKRSPPRDGAGGAGKSASNANKALIARNLRLAYGEVASEPLPDNWIKLLNQLDEPKGGQ
ncbi:MAG TPA: NepR family anti-sigma factor [Terricaulis sp.]|nr:NepR family anti-sigma factor [Terricaulis sp.]HRP12423.1 NepR family anti-sigma factor [Terricaulis sp.]